MRRRGLAGLILLALAASGRGEGQAPSGPTAAPAQSEERGAGAATRAPGEARPGEHPFIVPRGICEMREPVQQFSGEATAPPAAEPAAAPAEEPAK